MNRKTQPWVLAAIALLATAAAAPPPAARGDLPSADPIRRIELNMERWRWTGDPGGRYVLVNVPYFRLSVIEDGNTVVTMKVIVGKAHRKTPVFSDLMTQIVLNPPWNIPDSIAAGEIAPQLLCDVDPLLLDAERRDLGEAGGLDAVDPPVQRGADRCRRRAASGCRGAP